ncbi:MAG: hypothetical protein C4520_16980 [Candidatus Abyssobacteria bacterium SURF_5]|uniref:GNAT family N-acetyltransferase n=1 Tax=Abyssobacteria bacterium (strain SURF_5) TaxID=2093360 RepID=A0A3A4NP96_ABYX5|nr:MAG: hypothetical protein C4520_16980 [Candidatus Abyssubacteria bacterium SURF_5]
MDMTVLRRFWRSSTVLQAAGPFHSTGSAAGGTAGAPVQAAVIEETKPEAKRPPAREKQHYVCREACEDDLQAIALLFRRHNYGLQSAELLRWKYFGNPAGRAKIFVAENTAGEIVALRVHMPRLFTSRETGVFMVRQAVDWFVAEADRGTGVYSQLREFSRARRDYPTIGFPNEISRRITKTYPGDTRTYFPIEEWWFPVRLDQLFLTNRKTAIAPAAGILSKLYTFIWLGRRAKELRMNPIHRFERDFGLNPSFIHGVRSAEFLNWRFIDNPVRRYSAYGFFRGNENTGYCVYDIDESLAKIYDMVLTYRPRACLRLLIDHLRGKGISEVVFKSVGFRMRRYGFIRIGSPGDFDTLNTPQGDWLVSFADKD